MTPKPNPNPDAQTTQTVSKVHPATRLKMNRDRLEAMLKEPEFNGQLELVPRAGRSPVVRVVYQGETIGEIRTGSVKTVRGLRTAVRRLIGEQILKQAIKQQTETNKIKQPIDRSALPRRAYLSPAIPAVQVALVQEGADEIELGIRTRELQSALDRLRVGACVSQALRKLQGSITMAIRASDQATMNGREQVMKYLDVPMGENYGWPHVLPPSIDQIAVFYDTIDEMSAVVDEMGCLLSLLIGPQAVEVEVIGSNAQEPAQVPSSNS